MFGFGHCWRGVQALFLISPHASPPPHTRLGKLRGLRRSEPDNPPSQQLWEGVGFERTEYTLMPICKTKGGLDPNSGESGGNKEQDLETKEFFGGGGWVGRR